MEVRKITEDNVWEYSSWMGEDMAENLSRNVYRGLALFKDNEDKPSAGMVFRLKGLEGFGILESVIEWFQSEDKESGLILLENYSERIKQDGVDKSSFVISVKDSAIEKTVLKEAGFSVTLTEGDNILVSLSELTDLSIMKSHKVPDSIRTLDQLMLRKYRNAIQQCVLLGRTGLCEDLEELPMSWFDTSVSCYSEKNGNVNGLILFHALPSGILSIQLMVGLDENYQAVLLGLMRKSLISMQENYSEDTEVLLNRHNQASLMLSENMLPRSFGIPIYVGSREERGV